MTVRERLEALYALGEGEGANRPGLSPAEEEAHALAAGWMADAGLEVSRDSAGNLYGRLLGRRPDLPEVWVGSHLDSVPRGGRYDGALGVVAALEAVARMDAPASRTIAVVAFRDEEGWRFGHGFFGSRAVAGALGPGALDRHDRDGVSLRDALTSLGLQAQEGGDWLAGPPAAYLELHIEQGPVLAGADAPVGIVDSIVGLVELEIEFHGREGHAGTSPMDARRDAALCAAAFQIMAAERARAIPRAVATVGSLRLEPGASNVVPRLAHLVVDARAPDDERLDALEAALREAAASAASEHGCAVEIERVGRTAPVIADRRVVSALEAAAPGAPRLPSGAGHDAQILGAAGVPVGMLFARSLAGGISHSPLEESTDADIEESVEVLRRALPELCDRVGVASSAAPPSRADPRDG
ncbi:MAG TPA: Zn-dependent hydrolase [Baekduia sp.]|nr:Zn-dependent hydrolase [Baekduia sp.]